MIIADRRLVLCAIDEICCEFIERLSRAVGRTVGLDDQVSIRDGTKVMTERDSSAAIGLVRKQNCRVEVGAGHF